MLFVLRFCLLCVDMPAKTVQIACLIKQGSWRDRGFSLSCRQPFELLGSRPALFCRINGSYSGQNLSKRYYYIYYLYTLYSYLYTLYSGMTFFRHCHNILMTLYLHCHSCFLTAPFDTFCFFGCLRFVFRYQPYLPVLGDKFNPPQPVQQDRLFETTGLQP